MPPSSPSITIIGGGIAGLALGRCLLQRGIKAQILEKARNSTRRNDYGITLFAKRYRPLIEVLGIDEGSFRKRVAVDRGEGKVSAGAEDEESLRVNRNRFEALLAEGLDVRWEVEVVGIEGTGEGGNASVELGDGEKITSEVVVGADGPHSVLRKTIASDAEFKILPYASYNGKRRIALKDWEDRFAAAFKNGNVLEKRITSSGILLQISINDRGASSNEEESVSISYTFSRPAKQQRGQEDALYRPERRKEAAKETPEELFAEIAALEGDLQEPFKTVFSAEATRKDRLLNWLMRSILVDSKALDKATSKGLVILGDAAHAEPILGGLGANEAIEDSMVLAELLTGNDGAEGALKNFYAARVGEWEKSVRESEVRIANVHGKERASL